MNELMEILSPVLGEELAKDIIAHRTSHVTVKPFDQYRAKLALASFWRSPEPRVAAWEVIHRKENKQELSPDYLKACFRYDRDTGAFTRRISLGKEIAGSVAGSQLSSGYLTISVAGRPYLAHRLAWLHEKGMWPKFIDHIDRDKTNNRISNLRECTIQENNWNLSTNSLNTSGTRGVHWDSKRRKWMATIRVDGRTKALGRFEDIRDADKAYRAAVSQYRSAFLEA